jgi:integrase
MSIKLRHRKLKDGQKTLYLDCYQKGHRKLEYLGLYLVGDKATDKETMRLAEAIAAKRKLESVSTANDIPLPLHLQEDFIGFARKIEESQQNINTQLAWKHAIDHVIEFSGEPLVFGRLSQSFLEDFRSYLLKNLHQNSASTYFAKIKNAIRQAVRKKILANDPTDGLSIAMKPTNRVYLGLDELQALEKTDCENQAVKDAFLFSAFSGLRYCDVQRLAWSNVVQRDNAVMIEFRQQKTGNPEYLPLSQEAAAILERQRTAVPSKRMKTPIAADAVFKLPAKPVIDATLKTWSRRAGLGKHISYHASRHTFATLALKSGVDIYTVSKLLGHKTLRNTEIYAKVVDESKRKAVGLLPRLNG